MFLASTSSQIICHGWQNGQTEFVYTPHTTKPDLIETISWSKDANWLLLVTSKGKPEIVSFGQDKPKLLTAMQNFGQTVTCGAFQNTTKRYLGLGLTDGAAVLYDAKHFQYTKKFHSNERQVIPPFRLGFTAKDTHIVCGYRQLGVVKINNCVSGASAGTFHLPNSRILTNVRCHPVKNHLIATCYEEGIVALWDLNTSKTLAQINCHSAPVTDVVLTYGSNDLIWSSAMDRRLCLNDVKTKKSCSEILLPRSPTCIDYHQTGYHIATGLTSGQVFVYDVRNVKICLFELEMHQSRINQVLFDKIFDKNKRLSAFHLNVAFSEALDNKENQKVHQVTTDEAQLEISLGSECMIASDKANKTSASAKDITEDSFLEAIGINNTPVHKNEKGRDVANATRDSFLDAISVGNNNSLVKLSDKKNSVNVAVEMPKSEQKSDNNSQFVEINGNVHLKKSLIENFKRSQCVSTPNNDSKSDLLNQPFISPIFHQQSALQANATVLELKDFIRTEIAKLINPVDEKITKLTQEMSGLKTDIGYNKYDTEQKIRQCFLDNLWVNTKNFTDLHREVKSVSHQANKDEMLEALIEENGRLLLENTYLKNIIGNTLD